MPKALAWAPRLGGILGTLGDIPGFDLVAGMWGG